VEKVKNEVPQRIEDFEVPLTFSKMDGGKI